MLMRKNIAGSLVTEFRHSLYVEQVDHKVHGPYIPFFSEYNQRLLEIYPIGDLGKEIYKMDLGYFFCPLKQGRYQGLLRRS